MTPPTRYDIEPPEATTELVWAEPKRLKHPSPPRKPLRGRLKGVSSQLGLGPLRLHCVRLCGYRQILAHLLELPLELFHPVTLLLKLGPNRRLEGRHFSRTF